MRTELDRSKQNRSKMGVWGGVGAHHVAARERGPPADHVLVGAADVGGDDLQDGAVLALALLALRDHLALNMLCQYIQLWMYVIPAADLHRWRHRGVQRVELELGERDRLDLHFVRALQPPMRLSAGPHRRLSPPPASQGGWVYLVCKERSWGTGDVGAP